jgi:DNA modification methylase
VAAVLGSGIALADGKGGLICISGSAKGRKMRTIRLAGEKDILVFKDENGDLWKVGKEGIPAFDTIIGISHNTQKPVGLALNALRNSTEVGNIVLDLFNGSGSTLLACENLGRHGRGMELDRGYCMATILRWESLTKKKAVKII